MVNINNIITKYATVKQHSGKSVNLVRKQAF